VRVLLTSRQSAEAHDLEIAKMTAKFRGFVTSGNPEHSSVFALLEGSMQRLHTTRVLPNSFNPAQREVIVCTAC